MAGRLISADVLDQDFLECNARSPKWTPCRVRTLIFRQPTVDAVEVVRCKDCKHWGQDANGYTGEDESFCTNPDGLDNFAHPTDFCSYGERKANE